MGTSGLKVKFWGTRGWLSAPGPQNAIHGGNTFALEISTPNTRLILDSGFGITNLGDTLVAQKKQNLHILYSQFRWDHTQGLPFFMPIYFPENNIFLYAPHAATLIHQQLNVLFDSNFSPFEGLSKMPANIHCQQLTPNQQIGDLHLSFCATNSGSELQQKDHPPTYAYRISDDQGGSICVVLNHEATPGAINDAVVNLGKGCDLLVHDAMFSEANYAQHRGWGHSSDGQALDNAMAMGAKSCLLTLHSPFENDAFLEKRLQKLQLHHPYSRQPFAFSCEEKIYTLPLQKKIAQAG